MLEPLRNLVNWDNFRKGAVLVLILSAAASVLFGIICFFVLGGEGRSPAPADIFRGTILLVLFIAPVAPATGSSSKTRMLLQPGGRRKKVGGRPTRTGVSDGEVPLYLPKVPSSESVG